ncbi:MAG: hypothetical protein H6741_14300 [Alphaproteobacteria bacterium]|nr:hypothetical protein [Alphaproteobacteria bacterium]MCB9793887.1 hypothetical protein [Alphaproteobacteria bacterium]
MSALKPPEYGPLLSSLRAQRRREEFRALSEDFARRHPQRALSFCLPDADAGARRRLASLGPDHARLRPCFGGPGATLTLRSRQALAALTELGPALGAGLVRLVVQPGVGTEGLPELLAALPLAQLTALRLDGQGIRARRPVVVQEGGNLFRLHIAGDDDVIGQICALAHLTDLRLCDNRIGPAGAQALRALPGLRRLDLRGNAIGDEGAAALADIESLTELRLEDNCIGPAGALALTSLPRLRALDLRRNPIGPDAAGALARMPSLESLRLQGCGLDQVVRTQLIRLADYVEA